LKGLATEVEADDKRSLSAALSGSDLEELGPLKMQLRRKLRALPGSIALADKSKLIMIA
jgi:hypothetical protein